MVHKLEPLRAVATIGERRQGEASEPFTQVGAFIKAVSNHWIGTVIFNRDCSVHPRPTQGHMQLREEMLRPDPGPFHTPFVL